MSDQPTNGWLGRWPTGRRRAAADQSAAAPGARSRYQAGTAALLAGQLDRVTLGRRRVGQLDRERRGLFRVVLGGDLGGRRLARLLAPFVRVDVSHLEPPDRGPGPGVGPLHPGS